MIFWTQSKCVLRKRLVLSVADLHGTCWLSKEIKIKIPMLLIDFDWQVTKKESYISETNSSFVCCNAVKNNYAITASIRFEVK